MRATLLTAAVAAAATAALLASPVPGDRAAAMTFVEASASRIAADGAALLRPAAVVCGSNGCARVHTSRARPYPPRP
jgi:hypothetical protein